ncbi:MAG: hypothetical protein LBC57_00685 [Treponema sp.]|jgi:hypothetical protein|nr:hypothetical protein [Treponema sp.]
MVFYKKEACVFNVNEEKDRLAEKLAEQFSQNIIAMEEYERILEYINKIETAKEVNIIEKIMRENDIEGKQPAVDKNDAIITPEENEKHLTVFSETSSYIKSLNGNGGEYNCLFGENKIIVENLPKGRTLLNVKAIFGETEIIIAENIKITNRIIPVFSEIVEPEPKTNGDDMELPELYITGKAIFGEVKIKRMDEYNSQNWKKIGEKVMKKILDKIDKI